MTHSVVVDDLGDNGNVTSGRSVVNKDDSADFDESLEGGWLLGLNVSSGSGCLWMCDRGRAASPSPFFPSSLYSRQALHDLFTPHRVRRCFLVRSSIVSIYDVIHRIPCIPSSFPDPLLIHILIQVSSCSAILHLQLMLDLQPLLLSNYPINGEE
jgi:hypothetical protein